MSERKLVSLDWAMKRLLRSKANFDILEGFLSELLFRDIKIQSIGESETNQDDAMDKYNRVDIRVKDHLGEDIIIEIQFQSEYDYFHRTLYNISKAVCEQLDIGMDYGDIKKVIHINIVYFDLGRGDDYIYKQNNQFKGLHNSDILELSAQQKKCFNKQYPHELHPENYIIKVNKFNNVAKDSLDEWVYFLKNEEIKGSFKAKGIQKAKKKLNTMKLSKEARKEYERFVANKTYERGVTKSKELDLKYAKEEGIEQGIKASEQKIKKAEIKAEKEKIKAKKEKIKAEKEKEKMITTAKKLLVAGLDINFIAETTGFSLSELKKFKK